MRSTRSSPGRSPRIPSSRYSTCRELARAALAVTVDEASRLLADVAARAAAGRSDLGEVEAELAGKVIDLQLVREQARVLAGSPTPARVAAEGVCPFKGLASFEPADADYFFGRERLIAELVARLVGASFLGIVGPSGSGKSSVLRAGLLPALAGGVLPGSERWRRVLIRPGERPLDELRRMLASGAKDPVAEALDALTADERILLAVDQLEELFTACKDEAQRAAFVDMLARAAADPQGRAVVAVAVRADFYGRFAAFPQLAELLGANHVLVGPMQASELRRAVELPASRVGLRVERELADALVDDVEGEPGALPLLSTALLELWQKRQDNTLTAAVYRESGGVHGAVARLAEGTYARIPDEDKPLVRAIMLRLVGEGEGDAAVRRRAPLAELDLERNEEARERARHARRQPSRHRRRRAASRSPTRRCCASGRACGSGSRRTARAGACAATSPRPPPNGTEPGATGASSTAAPVSPPPSTGAATTPSSSTSSSAQFVAESREASEKETKRVRRTNRRLRGLLIGVAVLLAAAIAGGIFAVLQRGEARDAAGRGARAPRPPSSPSASARRRSSRRTSTSRCCSPARRWSSTTRLRTAAHCSPTCSASLPWSGSCTPHEPTPTTMLRFLARQPGREDARGGRSFAATSSVSTRRRTSSSASRSWSAGRSRTSAWGRGSTRIQPGRTHGRRGARTASLRLIDARTGEQLAETSTGRVFAPGVHE